MGAKSKGCFPSSSGPIFTAQLFCTNIAGKRIIQAMNEQAVDKSVYN